VNIDVLKDVDAGPLILEERDDSVSVRGLNGQRATGRLAIVERVQVAVDNQPLAQLRRRALLRDGTAAPSGVVVRALQRPRKSGLFAFRSSRRGLSDGISDCLDQCDRGGRVWRLAVGCGVDLAGVVGELGGVDVGSAVGLERESGLGRYAGACGNERLHDDDVVAG
jgi:hypothetical protein